MAEPTPAEVNAGIIARLTAIFRGDSEITDEVARAVAEKIYAVDAPRMANEVLPFDSLGNWDKVRFDRMARVAIGAFLEATSDETAKAQGG